MEAVIVVLVILLLADLVQMHSKWTSTNYLLREVGMSAAVGVPNSEFIWGALMGLSLLLAGYSRGMVEFFSCLSL